jgi:hypothetical protein
VRDVEAGPGRADDHHGLWHGGCWERARESAAPEIQREQGERGEGREVAVHDYVYKVAI